TGAQKVAARAVTMARKSHLRVAGVVENMSEFVAPDGSRHALFGRGGGEALAAQTGVPLLASIPIEPAVSAGGDAGVPVVVSSDGPAAAAFTALAERVTDEVAPPVEMASCTARMFEAAEAALAAFDAAGPATAGGSGPEDGS
ncbi:MAG: P-loop NTPase, partial [Acidimicrobiales bacterium]